MICDNGGADIGKSVRRTIATATALIFRGVADDLQSLMSFADSSSIGLAGQEVITKLPLCEDM